jgi:hypothetical protein
MLLSVLIDIVTWQCRKIDEHIFVTLRIGLLQKSSLFQMAFVLVPARTGFSGWASHNLSTGGISLF